MLYQSVCREARAVSSSSLAVPMSPEQWEATLPQRRTQWLEMLGLAPLPEATPLETTVTGILERDEYVVEKIHFQPLPGAYVTANLYRPPAVTEPLPAVLYLCGHTKGKVAPHYQAAPRWFGRNGYVALVLDPIQLGECPGIHHGTFNVGRWDWQSRGYTPAGMEIWIAMRALDYLQERPDVDPQLLGVTGLSGGGAMSWFLGAADERVKVVAPVCQTGTIEHIAADRATDGHCDCAFWLNYYRWCTPDIGALIAPRALLVAAGTEDVLWRPYAFRDAMHRIRLQYTALGIPDRAQLVENLTPHGYTPDLRQAVFSWFNKHLKGDDTPVTDSVTDYHEPEENLMVFGGNPPAEHTMDRVDLLLPRLASRPDVSSLAQWSEYRAQQLAKLRSLTFRHIPADPTPQLVEYRSDGSSYLDKDKNTRQVCGSWCFTTTDGLQLAVRTTHTDTTVPPAATVLFPLPEEAITGFIGAGRSRPAVPPEVATAGVEVRNTAATSTGPGYLWTLRRVYPLLGQTLEERQVYDLLAAVALLRREIPTGPTVLYGHGRGALTALYAALLDDQVPEVILKSPPESHQAPDCPAFLGILRIGDIPENLALLFPRTVTFIGEMPPAFAWTRELYEQLGMGERVRVLDDVTAWQPLV